MRLARAAVAALLTLAAFAPALSVGFLSDDFLILRALDGGGPLGFLVFGWSFFRPLTSLSLWLDRAAWGSTAVGFHATSLTLHAACAFAVGELARSLVRAGVLRDANDRLPVLATAAFAVAPSHAEPVCWLAARGDLLATLFGVAALALHLERRRALAIAAFFLALSAKESVLALPLVALALDRRPLRARLPDLGAFTLALAGFVVLRRAASGHWIGGYGTSVHLTPDPLAWLASLATYPWRAVSPALARTASVTTRLAELAGLAPIALAFALALSPSRRRSAGRAIALLTSALVLAALPVLSLEVARADVEGERFLYFPSVFGVVAISAALVTIANRTAQRVASLAFVAGWAVALAPSVIVFRTSGEIVRACVAALAAAPRDVVVIGLPESYRGAPTLRNGLREALAREEEPSIAAFTALAEVSDSVVCAADGAALSCAIGGTSRFVAFAGSELATPGDPPTRFVRVVAEGRPLVMWESGALSPH